MVGEPTVEETIEILYGLRRYEQQKLKFLMLPDSQALRPLHLRFLA